MQAPDILDSEKRSVKHMELTLNSAVMGVETSGIRRFTALAR